MPPQSVCTRCRQAVSRRKMLQWLGATTCPGHMTKQVANGAMNIERPAAMTTVRVGRSDLHTSHTIIHFQGIWWCARCGAYTNTADFAKSGLPGSGADASHETASAYAAWLSAQPGEYSYRLPTEAEWEATR